MRIFSSIVLLSLANYSLTQSTEKKDVSFSCLLYQDLSFFDFRSLQNKASDYQIQDKYTQQYYNFNLCSYTLSSCDSENTQIFAYKNQTSELCTVLTNQTLQTTVKQTSLGDNYIEIKYGQGEACLAGLTDQKYSLTIELSCDKDADQELLIQTVDSTDACNPKISASHSSVCPVFSVSSFAKYLLNNPFILGPIAIVGGLLVAFAGRHFFPMTISILGCLVGFGITMLLFSMYDMLSSNQSKGVSSFLSLMTSYLMGATIGIFLGFILQKMLHIAAAILGAVGGFFLGIAVYNLIFFFVESSFLLWSCAVLGSLGMAALSLKQYDNIVIFGTTFIGSYAFVRGCSLFLGGFPNEIKMFSGEEKITSYFYIYATVFVAIFVGGVLYQRRQRENAAKLNYLKH